ncbi:MAG: GNAT family N-acetyltransferase [Clostridia bacterium]|nr:GNAT family N-acetyltransferase [Clostridia bacterium]
MIRKAEARDLAAVDCLYQEIHDAEETGLITTGWIRGIYPVKATATAALERDDLFVLEEDGRILGSGMINRLQADAYEGAPWKCQVPDDQVCVLHTLAISPAAQGKGYGREFIRFYEAYARHHGCTELRIDTNERNLAARAMYSKYGYQEIDIVPTTFNGIAGVNLVLLEKQIRDER